MAKGEGLAPNASAEPRQSLEERVVAILTESAAIRAEVAAMRIDLERRRERVHLDDEQRERFRAMLIEQTDAGLVADLLTFQKIVEQWATGQTRMLAECVTTAIATTLERLAPETLADALAIYEEHAEAWPDEEDDEDA